MSGGDDAGAAGPPDVRVTTVVALPPAEAFRVFTEEIDAWWRRGPRFRFLGRAVGRLRFEGGSGGCLVEEALDGGGSGDDGAEGERGADGGGGAARRFVVGRVTAWEPGARLAFEWRLPNFAPDEVTFVELRFSPSPSGTQVVLEHRGLAALRPDHPARHGHGDPDYSAFVGRWWGEALLGLRLPRPA